MEARKMLTLFGGDYASVTDRWLREMDIFV